MEKVDRKRRISGKKLKALAKRYVVKTSENYRGLSYSDIIIRWLRWLLGDSPDRHQDGDILFLRGSVGYHKSSSIYLDISTEIFEGIAILVPIVTTHYTIGESYKGTVIRDEFCLRKAVREHVDAAGPFWAILEVNSKQHTLFKLVGNLQSFRIESMPFDLNISAKSPFLDKMDEPIFPGNYTALVSGYFVLLRDLPASLYDIRFGGYGMDGFYTDAHYEIEIKPKKDAPKDLSARCFAPNRLRGNRSGIKSSILAS